MKWLSIILLCSATTYAGELRTLSGQYHRGIVAIDPSGELLVSDRDGDRSTVPVADVVDAVLHEPDSPPVMQEGVKLVDGSVLAGRIGACDLSSVHLLRDNNDMTIPLDAIARVRYAAPDPADHAMLVDERPGALLVNGDFFVGSLAGLTRNRLQLASVVFGIRQFVPGQQVKELILSAVAPARADWEVRLMDGSTLLASELKIENGRLAGTNMNGKAFSAAPESVLGFSCGPARRVPLASLPADSVQLSRQGVAFVGSDLHLEAGASLSISLRPADRLVLGTFTVPRNLLPTSDVRLVLTGDGKVLFQSGPLSSLDPPEAFAVSLTGIKSLALKIQTSGSGELAGKGLLIAPELVTGAAASPP